MNPPEFINEIDETLTAEYHRVMAIDPRMRRFARALADLSFPVPTDWACHNGNDLVEFGPLSWDVFDQLVCLVEDLAEGRPLQVTVMQGAPTLFEMGSAPGPLPVPTQRTVHIEVPA